jgi:hypothetical protein
MRFNKRKLGVVVAVLAGITAVSNVRSGADPVPSPCGTSSEVVLTAQPTIANNTAIAPTDGYLGGNILIDGYYLGADASNGYTPSNQWGNQFANDASVTFTFANTNVASAWVYAQPNEINGTISVGGIATPVKQGWTQVPGLSGSRNSIVVARTGGVKGADITELKVCSGGTGTGGTGSLSIKVDASTTGQAPWQPALTVPAGTAAARVTFRATVTATGGPFANVTVTDPTNPKCSFTIGALAASATSIQTCQQDVPSTAGTQLVKTLSVSGTNAAGASTSSSSSSTVSVKSSVAPGGPPTPEDICAPGTPIDLIENPTDTGQGANNPGADHPYFGSKLLTDGKFVGSLPPAYGSPSTPWSNGYGGEATTPLGIPNGITAGSLWVYPSHSNITQSITVAGALVTFQPVPDPSALAWVQVPNPNMASGAIVVRRVASDSNVTEIVACTGGGSGAATLKVTKEASFDNAAFQPTATTVATGTNVTVYWRIRIMASGGSFTGLTVTDQIANSNCSFAPTAVTDGQTVELFCSTTNVPATANTELVNNVRVDGTGPTGPATANGKATAMFTQPITTTSGWHLAAGLPGTPECDDLTTFPPLKSPVDDTPTTWKVCVPFEGHQREATVPAFRYSFGMSLVPTGATLIKDLPWLPPTQVQLGTSSLTICSQDRHDSYWTKAPDGKYYPTWHPATVKLANGTTCSFAHEHGDDPRASSLFFWSGGVPFGFADTVYNQTPGLTEIQKRHEDHVGHKVVVQNKWTAMNGKPQNRPAEQPEPQSANFECYWMSHIHQGTHSDDALNHNDHEYHLNIMCDDKWLPEPAGSTTGSGATEARIKLLALFGDNGEFNDNCAGDAFDDRATVGYAKTAINADGTVVAPAGIGVVGESLNPDGTRMEGTGKSSRRSLPCADPNNSGQVYDMPLVPFVENSPVQQTGTLPNLKDPQHGMQHQNHYRLNNNTPQSVSTDARMEELWKPLARISDSSGKALFDSSAYYIVINPGRVVNKTRTTTSPLGAKPNPYAIVNVDLDPNLPSGPPIDPPNYYTADGVPFDPTLSTVDLCVAGGKWEAYPVCKVLSDAAKIELSAMTSLQRRTSPINPFNGSQRAIHPKNVINNNAGAASRLCTTAIGTDAQAGGDCPAHRIVQHVIQRTNSWTVGDDGVLGSVINSPLETSLKPGPKEKTNDTVTTPGGVAGTWGKEHEWVRIYDGSPLVPQNIAVPTVGTKRFGSLAMDTAYSSYTAPGWTLATIGKATNRPTSGSVALSVQTTGSGAGVSLLRRTPLAMKGGSVQLRLKSDTVGTVQLTACSDQWCFSKSTVAITVPKPGQWYEVTVPMSSLNYFGNVAGLQFTTATAMNFSVDQVQFLTTPLDKPLTGVTYRLLPVA